MSYACLVDPMSLSNIRKSDENPEQIDQAADEGEKIDKEGTTEQKFLIKKGLILYSMIY